MRCKPLPGPREGLNPLAAFERHPQPLCSRCCGPPAMAGLSDEEISSQQLRLHDAQSCIAREQGSASWPDLKRYVEVQAVAQARAVRVLHWLQLIYRGDVSNTA